jgi:Fe-S-cluster containining protein
MPPEVAGHELDARRADRLKTVAVLKKGRTPLTVIEVAAEATAIAEAALAEVKKAFRPPPLACAEGCDWCCYLPVGTTVPEVARIVDYLRRTLSPDELQAVRQRVVQLDDQRREMKAGTREDDWQPCPLLVDHRCSVYAVRPLTCRGANSRNARQCERFLKQRGDVDIPAYTPQHRMTTFVLDGMREGLAEAGLKGDLLELMPALRIALEVPDAVNRWLAGEPVFGPARFR